MSGGGCVASTVRDHALQPSVGVVSYLNEIGIASEFSHPARLDSILGREWNDNLGEPARGRRGHTYPPVVAIRRICSSGQVVR